MKMPMTIPENLMTGRPASEQRSPQLLHWQPREGELAQYRLHQLRRKSVFLSLIRFRDSSTPHRMDPRPSESPRESGNRRTRWGRQGSGWHVRVSYGAGTAGERRDTGGRTAGGWRKISRFSMQRAWRFSVSHMSPAPLANTPAPVRYENWPIGRRTTKGNRPATR
jgi:hypothetical protein